MPSEQRWYGKYRGEVTDIVDPEELGRLKVVVPEVSPNQDSWAMPCVPYAGNGVGLLLVPAIGTPVWVEFEGGDPARPIWTGCFWRQGARPTIGDKQRPDEAVGLIAPGFRLVSSAEPSGKGLVVSLSKPLSDDPVKLELLENAIRLAHGKENELVVDHAGIRLEKNGKNLTHLKVEADRVMIDMGNTRATVGRQDVKLEASASRLTVGTASAEIDVGGAKVKVAPATVNLTTGAAKLVMTGPSVNINDGALEVL